MKPLEIVFIDEPFKLEMEHMPLDKVYVIDNYLGSELHHWVDSEISTAPIWNKGNRVQNHSSKTGLPYHELWGASFLQGVDQRVSDECPPRWAQMPKWFNRRVQKDFGFMWERFQYMGTNSQTSGQHGTCHADCQQEDDFGLSFLYYTNKWWNPMWGGDLCFYDTMVHGEIGTEEFKEQHMIGSVEFKPNRLLMFDGRIPHGANAPHPLSKWADRKSIVLRGDEVRLVDNEEFFDASDRI